MMKTRIEPLMLCLTVLILLSLAGCGDEDPASPDDTIAPDAVTDLRVESVTGSVVTLTWTAPGDDGDTGTANEYDIRYSGDPITEGNWDAGTHATTEPDPAAAGTSQSAAIETGGRGDFHFALKTVDEASNWSSLSNVVMASVEEGFAVHQLTSEGSNIQPCLNDGHVVWVRTHNIEGDEIYIANLESAMPTPTALTDDGGDKAYPSNHGAERIVWQGREMGGLAGAWEIWLYDRYGVPRYAQFTDNEVPDRYPDLAGGGSFAWLQGYTMYEEVHYWHESMHSESVISDDCCPTSNWSNEIPSADDGAVVWRSYDRVGSEGHRTHLWDGGLTDLTETLDGAMTHDYSLYEGTIAYVYGASPAWIRYWDGVTVQEVGRGYNPSLYDGTIAYEFWDGHDWEIHYWDGTMVHEITDNDYVDMNASLHGSIIAWVGRPPGSADQIFYVNVEE